MTGFKRERKKALKTYEQPGIVRRAQSRAVHDREMLYASCAAGTGARPILKTEAVYMAAYMPNMAM